MRFKRYKLYFFAFKKLVRRRKFGGAGTSAVLHGAAVGLCQRVKPLPDVVSTVTG
jgi:hypothetical protein